MSDYILNNYRSVLVGDKHVLTTDHGEWIALDNSEFQSLESMNADKELLTRCKAKGIVITENNVEHISQSLRKKNTFMFQGTSLHIVVLTLRCNMKCVYCHASSKLDKSKGYDMSEETAKKVVDFILQTPADGLTIEFQGGEPLLNFEVLKFIVKYAKQRASEVKKSVDLTVVTNLTLMDDEKLDFLVDNEVIICTSIDGPLEVNKKNRIYHGKNDIEKWIGKISERSFANALPTITRYNLDKCKEIVDEYVRLGLKTIHLRPLNNLGYAKNIWSKISYSPEEFLAVWRESMDYILSLNKQGVKIAERMAVIMAKKILNNEEPNYLEQRSPCGAIIGQMAYDYDGSVYTCDEGRMLGNDLFKIGDVNQTMREVVQSSKSCSILATSSNDVFCDSCAFKPFCGICPVCNCAEQGSTVAKIRETDRCKIFMGQFQYMFEKILSDSEARKIFEVWVVDSKKPFDSS